MPKSQESSDLKLKEKLQKLIDKAQSGKSSPGDLQEAMELNDLLGGGFSSAVSLIAQAVEQQKQVDSKDTSIKDPIQQAEKLIAEDDKYFESAEVKQSEATAAAIAKGENVSFSSLFQMVSNITSKKDRAFRINKIEKYTEVIENLFGKAIDEGRELTSKEEKLLAKANDKRIKHLKRHHKDKAFTKVIGEHESDKAKENAVKQHASKLKEVSRDLDNGALREFTKVAAAGFDDLRALLKEIKEIPPEQRETTKPLAMGNLNKFNKGLLEMDLTPHIPQNHPSQNASNIQKFARVFNKLCQSHF